MAEHFLHQEFKIERVSVCHFGFSYNINKPKTTAQVPMKWMAWEKTKIYDCQHNPKLSPEKTSW
jgi:hypothetical protein